MKKSEKQKVANALLAAAAALERREASKKVSAKRKPYKANNGITYEDEVYAHIFSAADKIFDASFELQELLKGIHSGEYRQPTKGAVQDLKRAIGTLNRVGQKVYERKHSFE